MSCKSLGEIICIGEQESVKFDELVGVLCYEVEERNIEYAVIALKDKLIDGTEPVSLKLESHRICGLSFGECLRYGRDLLNGHFLEFRGYLLV